MLFATENQEYSGEIVIKHNLLVAQEIEVAKSNILGFGGRFELKWMNIEPSQTLVFKNVSLLETSRKIITIENTGNTEVELSISNEENSLVKQNDWRSKENCFSFNIEPKNVVIQPSKQQSFTVYVTGKQEGPDSFKFLVSTRGHVTPWATFISVSATVTTSVNMRNMQSFIKSDSTIEDLLDWSNVEDTKFSPNEGLWKILLPIIQLKPVMPSREYTHVPFVEPDITSPNIVHQQIRPPALMKRHNKARQKMMSNKIVAKLEQSRMNTESAEDPWNKKSLEQAIAAETIKPVEKIVYVNRSKK
ncbi:hypothetical protein BKA69DRAFT_771077 [Paraphysoderma sedebokerense]|nr:hypothetical protein BKA69DRAFT_771077 [Paraphysoderma sedebokerense]